MMYGMRTTVNIDAELLGRAKELAARSNRTIGSVLEEALRRHLSEDGATQEATVLPDFDYEGGLQPGVDLYDREVMATLLHDDDRHALS